VSANHPFGVIRAEVSLTAQGRHRDHPLEVGITLSGAMLAAASAFSAADAATDLKEMPQT
jgi:hypothetical protein